MYRYDPDFEINKFFNGLHVRVVGTPQYPLFYAVDIAEILGIQNITQAIVGFTGLEVLTDDARRRLGINTYRIDGALDNSIIILTLTGAIMMIASKKTEISIQLRIWLDHIIHEAHIAEKTEIITRDEQNMARIEQLESENKLIREKYESRKYRNERVYVFEISRDIRNIGDFGLHSDDEDSTDAEIRECDTENTIDDIEAYNKMIEQCPRNKISDNLYKITANPSVNDEIKYTNVHIKFVIDAEHVLSVIRDKLKREIHDCLQDNIYDCDLMKIKLLIDEVAKTE